jgi:probable rRNA maturation factor
MDPSDSSVLFVRSKRVLNRQDLSAFAARLQSEVTRGKPFVCMITDNRELRRLNRAFLGKDYATDVLSFPSGDEGDVLGEIAISTDMAVAQAAEFGHTPDEEVRILMLHGVLHLMGMDHESDRGAMARAEKKLRRKFSLPTSLTERAAQ